MTDQEHARERFTTAEARVVDAVEALWRAKGYVADDLRRARLAAVLDELANMRDDLRAELRRLRQVER